MPFADINKWINEWMNALISDINEWINEWMNALISDNK